MGEPDRANRPVDHWPGEQLAKVDETCPRGTQGVRWLENLRMPILEGVG